MKKVYLIILVLSCFAINAKAQSVEDTLREQITEMKDRINGIDERLMTSESDLSKLTKIKFSGYIQAQFDRFENRAVQPNNYFSLRRVRLKATYEATLTFFTTTQASACSIWTPTRVYIVYSIESLRGQKKR